ncbi:MAG TPA: protein kinase, partial [Blastocatellia bacterium]|nr:protein kinase [Blastocatellia bacterium]
IPHSAFRIEKWPHISYCLRAMAAKFCPTCQKTFTSAERLCPQDRSVLSLNDPYHLVGRTLLDKYRIDALVGLGGMGAVYYAYHSGIDRCVAFKILQPNLALSEERVVEMFEREAKLAGRLSHENIVDVKDAGRTDEGIAYIVMEWLEGRTLDEELLRQGRFGFGRAAGIARQIAAALGEAHGKNVIHRDLKPANIMLINSSSARDHVKVLDFGIGKALGETLASSMVSTVVGTPHYASPEQLTVGGRIDGRSDIYSLGVILYRMLSGKPPFNSPSIGEVIQMQLTAEPAPLITVRPETPPAVERLVASMLAKNPSRRPQSAVELSAALNQAFSHSVEDDVTATGETTIQRGHNPLERTTEGMYVDPPLRGTFSTNVQRPGRFKPSTLSAAIIVAALATGGYALYHYVSGDVSGDGRREISQASVATPPTPSPTLRPSPSVTNVQAPSPKPTAVVTPPPRTNSRPRDRRDENPPPANRPRQEDRQLADKHYERARELLGQSQYQAARRECDKALRLNPEHGKARELKRQIDAMIRIFKPR